MKSLRAVSPSDTARIVNGIRAALTGGDALCVTSGPLPVAEVDDNCAVVVLTSGSTASPKRVALSADALIASTRATELTIGRGRWVLALPLDYIAGLMVLVRAQAAETDPVVYQQGHFDAADFCRFVAGLPEGSWFTSLVPTQLERLVSLADGDESARSALGRFERILVGGQAMPAGLIPRARALGLHVTTTYGSAETAGGVVYDGVALKGTMLRIGSDERIEIATPSLALGYLGDAARTAESFVVDNGTRWWRTTDRGEIVDGRLRVLGRMDDVIVSGGIKVALGDIDRVLDAVGLDAVAGWFPDERWGQVPGIVSTTDINLDDLRDRIERELGKAARPYRVARVDEIPRLPSGKVDRVRVNAIVARAT